MMTYRAAIVLATLLGLAATAGAADDKLGTTLRGVVEENVRAYDARDTDAFLRTLHPQSPGYEATKAILSDQFREGDIKVTLVDYKYIGHDDEFAVARVKLKTVGASRQHQLPEQRDRQRRGVPPGRIRPRLEAVERRRPRRPVHSLGSVGPPSRRRA